MGMTIGLLAGLGLAILLPCLAASGRWWRGLWFGLCVPAVLLAVILGSEPVDTKYSVEQELGHAIDDQTFAVMNGLDEAWLGIFLGAAAGSFIAGCVYRPKKPAISSSVIFCTSCGMPSSNASRFCSGCGSELMVPNP